MHYLVREDEPELETTDPLRWSEELRLAGLDLAEKTRLAKLAEETWLAEWSEEVCLTACSSKGTTLSEEEEAHVVDSALHEASRMTEWKEEIRLANWCKEGYPLRWD